MASLESTAPHWRNRVGPFLDLVKEEWSPKFPHGATPQAARPELQQLANRACFVSPHPCCPSLAHRAPHRRGRPALTGKGPWSVPVAVRRVVLLKRGPAHPCQTTASPDITGSAYFIIAPFSMMTKFIQYQPDGPRRKPLEHVQVALERARRGFLPAANPNPRKMVFLSARYRYEVIESPLHRDKVSIAASIALARYFTMDEWTEIVDSGHLDEAIEVLQRTQLLSYWANYVQLLLKESSEFARQAMSGMSDRSFFIQYAH